MKFRVAILLLLASAVPALATPPQPMILMRLEWQPPAQVRVRIESKLPTWYDTTMRVYVGESATEPLFEQPLAFGPGVIETAVTVPIDSDFVKIGFLVVTTDDKRPLFSDRIYVARNAEGVTRQLSTREVDAIYEQRRRAARAQHEQAMIERARARVRDVIARGRRPFCSPESAPIWNIAVVEELGDAAPPSCRDAVAQRQ